MNVKSVLVTGGAGYIGSHAVSALNDAGYSVTVLDNLSSGSTIAVLSPARLIVGDVSDESVLESLFKNNKFSAVMHFAASISVPDSISDPLSYYDNNVTTTISLLKFVERYKIPYFVFSSSAAVYGNPEITPVTEATAVNPVSPYGRSKLIGEMMIQDLASSAPWFNYVLLRYFNVAGCDPNGLLGQHNYHSKHLIRLACQAALGVNEELQIFGDDYPTIDGTGVRDFIHVSDLAQAHVVVLKDLQKGNDSGVFNCGYGTGYSVLEIVSAVKEVSGRDFNVVIGPRRAGDLHEVVADTSKLLTQTDWRPLNQDINAIIKSTLEWERKLAIQWELL